MITQFYRVGGQVIKIVIDKKLVTIYDAGLAIKGVTADEILARDEVKKAKWNAFMETNPTERDISNSLEKDFKHLGMVLGREIVK